MPLRDSHISMRPLYSNILFKLVDYIFVICFMKCLSWLVGVQFRPCQCFCKCIIIMLCKLICESVIELWALGSGPEKVAQILESQAQA